MKLINEEIAGKIKNSDQLRKLIDESEIDNLANIKQEICDYIKNNPESLTNSSDEIRKTLPATHEIQHLAFKFIEYHINITPVLRFRERFLVKSCDKPFALVEAEYIFFWDEKNNEVSKLFNRSFVYTFDEAATAHFADYNVNDFRKVIAVHGQSILEVELPLEDDYLNTKESDQPVVIDEPSPEKVKEAQKREIEQAKINSDAARLKQQNGEKLTPQEEIDLSLQMEEFNEKDFNEFELVRLELQIENLFRNFNVAQATIALRRANYLNQSIMHTRWQHLENSIHNLSTVIKANTSQKLAETEKRKRYSTGSFNILLEQYSDEDGQIIDNTEDHSIQVDVRSHILKQQNLVIDNSDEVIQLPEYANILNINPVITENAKQQAREVPKVKKVYKQPQNAVADADAQPKQGGFWFAIKNGVKKHPYFTAFILVSLVLATAAAIAIIVHTSGAAIIPIIFAAKAVGAAVGVNASATAAFYTGLAIFTAAVPLFQASMTAALGWLLKKFNAPEPPLAPVGQASQPKIVTSGKSQQRKPAIEYNSGERPWLDDEARPDGGKARFGFSADQHSKLSLFSQENNQKPSNPTTHTGYQPQRKSGQQGGP